MYFSWPRGQRPRSQNRWGTTRWPHFQWPWPTRATQQGTGKEIPDRTEWVNIVAWRGLASLCEGYVKKGSMLYVEGRLTTRSYEKEGTKFYVTEVVAENIQLCGSKQREQVKGARVQAQGASQGSVRQRTAKPDEPLTFLTMKRAYISGKITGPTLSPQRTLN